MRAGRGRIIDKLTAESQVYGGIIMGIGFALFEHRILDRNTAQMVNPNMEFYLLPGMSDIPDIDITLMDQPERGPVGLGEPPVISTAAAVGNAIANAIGVRVRSLPLTPTGGARRAERREGRRHAMKAFAYVNAANEKEAIASLGPERGRMLPLAGGMDLLAMMKDYVAAARAAGQRQAPRSRPSPGRPMAACASASAVTLADIAGACGRPAQLSRAGAGGEEVGTPQIRNVGTLGGNMNQRPRCWYFRNEEFACLKKGGARCFAVEGENLFHAIFGEGPCHIVHPSSLAVPAVALNARFRVVGPAGEREIAAGDYYQMPDRNLFGETVLAPNELLTHVLVPAPGSSKNATYEVRYKQSHDWPLATASVALR